MIQFRPNPDDLALLKIPFGDLLPGGPAETMPRLALLVRRAHPARVAAVGDVVSRETLLAGIPVDLRIVDHRSMRNPISSQVDFFSRKIYHVRNPAGVITQQSLDAIKEAMVEGDALILVDGEEDLLTLPCILESPSGAFVIYGQPSKGLVVVRVNSIIKDKVASLMRRMTKEPAYPP